MGPDAGAEGPRLPFAPVHDLVVQEREADLVVGTHGRSIWIVDVGLVQQMTPEVVGAALHVFAPDTLTHNESWGTRGYTWADAPEPALQLAYATTQSGTARVRVLDAEGDVLWEAEDAAEPGLNLLDYGLRSDRALTDGQEPGEDTGAFYLVPGEYAVEVRLAGRAEDGAARRGGRAGAPQPGAQEGAVAAAPALVGALLLGTPDRLGGDVRGLLGGRGAASGRSGTPRAYWAVAAGGHPRRARARRARWRRPKPAPPASAASRLVCWVPFVSS